MSAARIDVIVEEGSDFSFEFVWLGTSCATTDVTGYGAKMEFRDEPLSTVLWTLSTANGRITIAGTTGLFSLLLEAASVDVYDSTKGKGKYDIKVFPNSASPAVNPIRLIEGGFTYNKQITQ